MLLGDPLGRPEPLQMNSGQKPRPREPVTPLPLAPQRFTDRFLFSLPPQDSTLSSCESPSLLGPQCPYLLNGDNDSFVPAS